MSLNYKFEHKNRFVDDYFNKKFEFQPAEDWVLPSKIYEGEQFVIDSFQQRKDTLNSVKEKLSKFNLEKWSKHTRQRDPSTVIIQTLRTTFHPELITQAWVKFYECLSQYDLVPQAALNEGFLHSAHLCEAPGAFICSLNHYLHIRYPNLKWKWLGMTLNPNYEGNATAEMIPDDRFIRYTHDKWFFGPDLTGDLTRLHNHNALVSLYENVKVDLVTCDGSIDCMSNPGDQEKIVGFLHYCEAVTALKILRDGGNLVIKMFTMFEESTICLMYLLVCCFNSVNVFKPCTSKSGNSEVYVICKNYNKNKLSSEMLEKLTEPYKDSNLEKSMFDITDINNSFLRQISACSEFFMQCQISTINENIENFSEDGPRDFNFIRNRTKLIVDLFLQKNPIISIPNHMKLVRNRNMRYFEQNTKVGVFPNLRVRLNANRFLNNIELDELLDLKVGKYLVNLYYSKYHPIKNYSYYLNRKSSPLFSIVGSYLSSNNVILTSDDLSESYGVSSFHKLFVNALFHKIDGEKNFIIANVPFLTNFLVGLILATAICFEYVWFIKDLVVFEKPISRKIVALKTHLSSIIERCSLLNTNNDSFVEDILQIVNCNILHTGEFYDSIFKYNVNVLRDVYIESR